MRSVSVLKRKVRDIEKAIIPENIGLAFLTDNRYSCEGNTFFTEHSFNDYIKEQGFTRVYVITWVDSGEKLTPEQRARVLSEDA